MKKHENQMSAAEKEALVKRVAAIAEKGITDHAADRMAQKGVTAKEIEICLKYGHAIECNTNDPTELRAVIRHAFGKPKVAVCTVVGLTSGNIVTCYKNAGSDNHKTLDLSVYEKAMPILRML